MHGSSNVKKNKAQKRMKIGQINQEREKSLNKCTNNWPAKTRGRDPSHKTNQPLSHILSNLVHTPQIYKHIYFT